MCSWFSLNADTSGSQIYLRQYWKLLDGFREKGFLRVCVFVFWGEISIRRWGSRAHQLMILYSLIEWHQSLLYTLFRRDQVKNLITLANETRLGSNGSLPTFSYPTPILLSKPDHLEYPNCLFYTFLYSTLCIATPSEFIIIYKSIYYIRGLFRNYNPIGDLLNIVIECYKVGEKNAILLLNHWLHGLRHILRCTNLEYIRLSVCLTLWSLQSCQTLITLNLSEANRIKGLVSLSRSLTVALFCA